MGKIENISLVHSLEAHPYGFYAAAIASCNSVPLILTAHGTYGVIAKEKILDRILYNRVLRKAFFMTTVSSYTRKEILKTFPRSISPEKVFVMDNPIDMDRILSESEKASEISVQSRPLIVTVCNLKDRKGVDVSIRAFARIRRLYPNAEFHIIGPGIGSSYHRRLMEIIETEDIDGVEFKGLVSDDLLWAYLKIADLFLLTPVRRGSHFEGYGLVYLEAGALGIPVVGSDSGGVPSAVVDGLNGLIAKENDPIDTADKALSILDDPNLAARLSEGGRRLAGERNWQDYAFTLNNIYQRIIGNKFDERGH